MKILNLENSNIIIEKSKDELRLESVKKNNQTIEIFFDMTKFYGKSKNHELKV